MNKINAAVQFAIVNEGAKFLMSRAMFTLVFPTNHHCFTIAKGN